MKKTSSRFGVRIITQGAMIAALYVVLTYLSSLFGLASGAIQVRLSEMLTVLPYFTPAAIPGLFIGCVVLLIGMALWFVIGKRAEQWIEEKGRTLRGLLCIATIFTWAFISLSQVSTFLYFNF